LSFSADLLVGAPEQANGVTILKALQDKKNGSAKRRVWSNSDIKALKAHSKARTPVIKISKETKRTVGSLRQKALSLGIGLGHQR
jgi:hypothetical protein